MNDRNTVMLCHGPVKNVLWVKLNHRVLPRSAWRLVGKRAIRLLPRLYREKRPARRVP